MHILLQPEGLGTWSVVGAPHRPPPVDGVDEPGLEDVEPRRLGVHRLVGLHRMEQHHRPRRRLQPVPPAAGAAQNTRQAGNPAGNYPNPMQ